MKHFMGTIKLEEDDGEKCKLHMNNFLDASRQFFKKAKSPSLWRFAEPVLPETE